MQIKRDRQIIISFSETKDFLLIENLPALPPDKVYVLWTVLKKGASLQGN
ncbi:MAG: anti-sigma factor [Tatlockia sp.]|nr:anti-sigma factor [Tatlockia sp.]